MIPTVDHLASAPLTHHLGDLFSPPALTNFLGSVQVAVDVAGVRSLNFPPFGSSDAFPPVTWADSLSGALFLDGRYVAAQSPAIRFQWRPDRVRREAEVDGWAIRSDTILPFSTRACLVRVHVENRTGRTRRLRLGFGIKATVTSNLADWDDAIAPAESDNEAQLDPASGGVLFSARHSRAVSLQATLPAADRAEPLRLEVERSLSPGAAATVTFVHVIETTAAAARDSFASLATRIDAVFDATEAEWNHELAAAFTPGNDRFSGHLPRLETNDPSLTSLYHAGVLAAVYFKRELAHAVLPRVYTTLMPRYWPTLTWLWDYQLGSVAHALLDPEVMRAQIEHWIGWDVQSFMATDWLTGRGVGHWYAVNDHAMVRLVGDYVRWSGDRAWLDHRVEGPDGSACRVIDATVGYAEAWRRRRSAHGLADYGSMSNLLECVPTYAHEVAGLNAANVANLREAADLLTLRGAVEAAAPLRSEAEQLLGRLAELYVAGAGHWATRRPDGSRVPVRHCVDWLWTVNNIAADLDADQQREIADFFAAELRTDSWMRALSASDPAAVYDVRPDHQWSGAFAAWPAEVATGLCRIGRVDLVAAWLPGLARVTRQGPIGQAHFADGVVASEAGGARKAPSDFPYLTDWACSAAAAWVRFIVEGMFGVAAAAGGALEARPLVDVLDANARLVNLPFQGRLYRVTAGGAAVQDGPE